MERSQVVQEEQPHISQQTTVSEVKIYNSGFE